MDEYMLSEVLECVDWQLFIGYVLVFISTCHRRAC